MKANRERDFLHNHLFQITCIPLMYTDNIHNYNIEFGTQKNVPLFAHFQMGLFDAVNKLRKF